MKLVKPSFVALSIVLLAPAIAVAGFGALPQPADPVIKPPRSIGGVKLGMKLGDADETWGGVGKCVHKLRFHACTYGRLNEEGYAEIDAARGKVALVVIAAGFTKHSPKAVYEGPLLDFTTEKGEIGLGSRLVKVKKTYRRAHRLQGGIGYSLPGRGKSELDFLGDGAKKQRISSILLFNEIPE
jgi:hypothetical protein